jgi:GntR family phosphonate transport system transcriptional regulator
LISVSEEIASPIVAENLAVSPGSPVALVCVVGEADHIPISFGRNYFPCTVLPTIVETFRTQFEDPTKHASITSALQSVGVVDYRRRSTRIGARTPTVEEARYLKMPSTEYVLETESVDEDVQSRPVTYAKTCFRSSRVQFVVEAGDGSDQQPR